MTDDVDAAVRQTTLIMLKSVKQRGYDVEGSGPQYDATFAGHVLHHCAGGNIVKLSAL